MANQTQDRSSRPATHESELLPTMLAIILAVAAQLALDDGLTLLGLAGYIVAAWLFVSNVRATFEWVSQKTVGYDRRPDGQQATVEGEAVAKVTPPDETTGDADRLGYLRRHWRQVTLAEIFAGDIPPARLRLKAGEPVASGSATDQGAEAEVVDDTKPQGDSPGTELPGASSPAEARSAAQMTAWAASDSSRAAPRSVKVTPQGDVLVLDTGLEQIQHFDDQGNLQMTYPLAGLSDVTVLDLDVSPDGRTLYIVDAASNSLRVITLSDVDSAGEEE